MQLRPFFDTEALCGCHAAETAFAFIKIGVGGLWRSRMSVNADQRVSMTNRWSKFYPSRLQSSHRILSVGYNFKMCRIDATPDATEVVKLQTSGDGGVISLFIGEPMRCGTLEVSASEDTISSDIQLTSPKPAGFGFAYSEPKPFRKRLANWILPLKRVSVAPRPFVMGLTQSASLWTSEIRAAFNRATIHTSPQNQTWYLAYHRVETLA